MPVRLTRWRVLRCTLSPVLRAVELSCILHLFLPGAEAPPPATLTSPNQTELFEQGEKLVAAHNFVDALLFFTRVGQLARRVHDSHWEARAQFMSGACQLHLFRYRDAISDLQAA